MFELSIYNTIYSFPLKAPGEDGITRLHLIHLPKILYVNLAHIYTAALALGYYPSNIKNAIMVFIPKPGKPHCDPSNYRPISLLSVVGKVYGKILTQRLTMYIADKNKNHPHQYGFVQNRGTLSSLAMLYEFISRQKCGIWPARLSLVLRDIKGAFDRLDHRRVKYHLYDLGIPPVLRKALSSFLDGRTARIRVGDVTGPSFPILAGAPQGASPSAKIFTLVIRDAPIGININNYFTNYADDCAQAVVTQGENINYHQKDVIKAINIQNEFESREGLMSEPSKSYIVPIGHDACPQIIVDGHEYQVPSKPVTLLGLDITRRSMIGAHVNKQVKKARKVLTSLFRFSSMKRKFKVQLVKTLVLPHLFYPTVPLHLASRPQMRKLQVVQNLALRWAFGVKWYDKVNNRKLHTEYKPYFQPVNQVLYWRARALWDKIENGGAGDPDQLKEILEIPQTYDYRRKELFQFPSSYRAAMKKPEPAPFYR